MQEPQPALRKRQRDGRRPRPRAQRRPRRGGLLICRSLGKVRDGGSFEQAADRDLSARGRSDTADQPGGQERGGTELGEVAGDGYAVASQPRGRTTVASI